jgi:hypothetical protein
VLFALENIRRSIERVDTVGIVSWSQYLCSATLYELFNLRVEATIVKGEVAYKAEDTNIAF